MSPWVLAVKMRTQMTSKWWLKKRSEARVSGGPVANVLSNHQGEGVATALAALEASKQAALEEEEAFGRNSSPGLRTPG